MSTRFSFLNLATSLFFLTAGCVPICGQVAVSKVDPFDDPSVLDKENRSAFREVAGAVRDVRIWKRLGGISPVTQRVPKTLIQLKPDGVYKTKLSISEFVLLGKPPSGKWTAVEVRRYGKLLLAFRIENGKIADAYSYVGYDKAGDAAGRVDRFYLAVQNENLKEARELSRELTTLGNLDFDMECALWALESRVGDKQAAARLQNTVNSRAEPLVPSAITGRALANRSYAVIDLLGYRTEHHSIGCIDR